jgi:hypothetical protein
VYGDVSWSAVTVSADKLPWRGKGAAEAEFGADLAITFNIELPEFQATKGILIQAKMLDTGHRLNPAAFVPIAVYDDLIANYLLDLRSQAGVSGFAVLAPGDKEAHELERRRHTGIPLSAETWTSLKDFALRFGVEAPHPLT